jgi:hypothetical protein
VGLAVLAALRSCRDTGPVLVAIDDVQWLDAGSIEALAFALRRITTGPLGVLLAARTEAPADPLTIDAPPLPDSWRDLPAARCPEPGGSTWCRWISGRSRACCRRRRPPAGAAGRRPVPREPVLGHPGRGQPGAAETPVPQLALTLTRRLARSVPARR